jgi:hypothetical protein
MTMTQTQARAEAMRLAGEGKTHATIAEHLAAKGYVSARTGKPLSRNGIGQMLIKSGHRTYSRKAKRRGSTVAAAAAKTPAKRVPSTSVDKLQAVKSILNVASMDANERIAFALLMIG